MNEQSETQSRKAKIVRRFRRMCWRGRIKSFADAKAANQEIRMRILGLTLLTIFIGSNSLAEAQQPQKVYRLGFLSPAASPAPSIQAASNLVPKLLRELGYVEGQNLVVHRHFAGGELELFPQLAKELVDLRVDG